jgi:YedE family putative selenium metabolism protein
MNLRDRHLWEVVATGLLLGVVGVLLSLWGNPENSGICVSCFIENSAGALGFHDNPHMQYLRPELIGFVLGATLSSLGFREFRSRGGSAPLPRLVAGIVLMVGCGVFIGCPIKLFLRITAGDLTALAGVVGLVVGVWIGLKGLAHGVDLGQAAREPGGSGWLVPLMFALLLVFLVVRPGFVIFSGRGSAAQHADWSVSLGAGLLLGALAQRSRFCITGSIRDTLLMGRKSYLLWGGTAFIATALALNLAGGRFRLGFYGQPGAHSDHLWSFLGMLLVGWTAVLIGGCPFRQLIKAGEGDADAGLVVMGMFIGGALVESWGIAATTAGVPALGKVAALLGFVFVIVNCLLFRERSSS